MQLSMRSCRLINRDSFKLVKYAFSSSSHSSIPCSRPPGHLLNKKIFKRLYSSNLPKEDKPYLDIALEDAVPLEIRHGISPKTTMEFRDRLGLVEACLRTNQLYRAQVLFNNLKCEKELFEKLVDVHVHNSFLESFVSSFGPNAGAQQYQELFNWFRSMRKSNIQPNVTSFAILIKGALHCKLSDEFICLIVQDMRRCLKDFDVTAEVLFESYVLESVHVEKLRNIINSNQTLSSSLSNKSAVTPSNAKIEKSSNDIGQSVYMDIPTVTPSNAANLEYVKKPLMKAMASSESLLDQQIAIEQESFRANLQFMLDESDKKKTATGIGILPAPVRKLATSWHRAFMPVLERQIQRSAREVISDRQDVGPFLSLFDKYPEKLSVVVISQFIKSFSEGVSQIKSMRLVMDIGEGVEQEYKMMLLKNKKLKEKLSRDYFKQQDFVSSKKLLNTSFRKLQAMEIDNNVTGSFSFTSWEKTVKVRIGSLLASWFMEVAKVGMNENNELVIGRRSPTDSYEKAFSHDIIRERSKQHGVVRVNDVVSRAFETYATDSSSGTARGMLLPKLLPMLVPPKPWLTHDSGGYITIKTQCMRIEDPQAEAYMREGSLSGRLEKVFNGLDVLGQTAWRINSRLLKVVIEAWNTGLPIGGLPQEIPKNPPNPLPKPENFDSDIRERIKWRRENQRLKQKYFDMKSMRITENYKLEIARAFVGKTLYFPHNIDFRGRAYPIPQLFSHIGNDLARSLLIFDEAKPLGSDGLQWLKIHLANTFGYDKATFEERCAFAEENMDKIMKCAEDPLGEGEDNQWWKKADKPWLFLSVAMELSNAIKSGSPETFESRLPVHQDGSCNGLQHYAALGGDLEGATQVNLKADSDRPQDVYSAVANKVKEMVTEDLNGYQPAENEPAVDFNYKTAKDLMETPQGRYYLAKLITPERIERKTVKQTVMTTVYGVTFVGARQQVTNRLKEKYENEYSPEQIAAISRYLTIKIFASLNNMFSGAREIQNWFATTAKEIARSVPPMELKVYQDLIEEEQDLRRRARANGKPVEVSVISGDTIDSENASSNKNPVDLANIVLNSKSAVTWTTPVGLTVIQPYKYTRAVEVKTALQTFKLLNTNHRSPVDITKQTAAFPPNFIHSLDASHMLMTAIECHRRNLTFASVHDSYWTHACDINNLRHILRDKFVELHSQPLLENLYDEFQSRYADRKVLNVYAAEDAVKKLDELNQKGKFKYKLDKKRSCFVFDSEASVMNNSKIDEESNAGLEDEDGEEVVDKSQINVTELSTDGSVEQDCSSDISGPTEDELAGMTKEEKFKSLGLRKNQKYVKVWENLAIPDLPPKGTFNVEEVRNSKYFFN